MHLVVGLSRNCPALWVRSACCLPAVADAARAVSSDRPGVALPRPPAAFALPVWLRRWVG